MMSGTNQCLRLLPLLGMVLLLQTSTQLPSYRTSKSKCSNAPRPLNKPIRACWDYTRRLETTLLEETDAKTDVCLNVMLDVDNHKLGVEIMRTSKTIYCFGIARGSEFSGDDFIQNINGIWTSKSEIVEDPDVCVQDGDYSDVHCPDMDLSDLSFLYYNVVEQVSLLEELFMGTQYDI